MKPVLSFIPQAVRALLLAMLLSWSALLNATDLSQSHILVATPELRDSIFGSSILVVTPIGGDRHMGVIVNRPAGVTLGKIFPEHGPSQKITDAVYFGGPVGAEFIFALVQRPDSPPGNSFELLPGLYLVVEAADVDRVIESEADHARFVAGLVAWRAGELTEEVKSGAWYVLEPNADVAMRRPEGLLGRDGTALARGNGCHMKGILNHSFRYRPSFATDIRKTFERIRRENEAAAQQKVIQINRSKKTS